VCAGLFLAAARCIPVVATRFVCLCDLKCALHCILSTLLSLAAVSSPPLVADNATKELEVKLATAKATKELQEKLAAQTGNLSSIYC
jgi:hypothetical protein